MKEPVIKAVPMPGNYSRWVMKNINTGEILDDAQGYGYRTAQKAHAAWVYKHPSKKQAGNRKKNMRTNKTFVKEHPSIGDDWAQAALDVYKDGGTPGYQDFKELVEYVDPKFSGNMMSLYHYVQDHC